MDEKNKKKNKLVKIISFAMLLVIAVTAFALPASALVTVGGSNYYNVSSTFPITVSMMYDYDVSESKTENISRPYTFSIDIGGSGNNYPSVIDVGCDTFDYNVGDSVYGLMGQINYSVDTNSGEDYTIFYGGNTGTDCVGLSTKTYSLLANANISPGSPFLSRDILQKVCFTADDIVYNPYLLLYQKEWSMNPKEKYIGLPYVELYPTLMGKMIDYEYKCSFNVTTNYGLEEHIEYTMEWRGNTPYRDSGDSITNHLYLINPEAIEKFGGCKTIVISNFVGELDYTFLTENDENDFTPDSVFGCWKIREPVADSSIFSESNFYGEFYVGTSPIENPTPIGNKYYSCLSFQSGGMMFGKHGELTDSLLIMYHHNKGSTGFDGNNFYLYVDSIGGDDQASLLYSFLIENADYMGLYTDTYKKDNSRSAYFDDNSQTIKLNLPFYDTSRVGAYDNAYNDFYIDYLSYPDFEKFINTLEIADGDESVIGGSFASPSWTNWLVKSVGGFFNFEVFPHFSIGGLLSIIFSFSLVLILLRWCSG